MKTIILFLFCLTLTAADAWAKDYHLVATQLRGATPSGTPPEFPVIYVLLMPKENGEINPLVYQKFDSKDMELDMSGLMRSGFIARGSVLHLDLQPDLERPSGAQMEAFENFCKKLGITLVVSATA